MTLRRRLGNLSDRIDGVATSSAARVSFSRRVVCRIFWSKKKENNLEWNEFPMHAVEHFPESRFYCQNKKEQKKRRWIVSQRFDRFLPSFTDCYRVSPVYRVDTKDQRHGGFIDCGFFYVDFLLSNLLSRPHHGGRTAQASRRRRAGAAAAAEPPTQRRRCRSVSSVVADRCRFRAALSDFFFPSTPHTSAPSRPGKEEPKTTPFLFY